MHAQFVVGPRSDLLKMVCRVLDARVRPDRISLRALKPYVLRVRTRTVASMEGSGRCRRHFSIRLSMKFSVVTRVNRTDL